MHQRNRHDDIWKNLLFDERLPSLQNPYFIRPGDLVKLVLLPNAFGETDVKFVAAGVKTRPLPSRVGALSNDAQEMITWVRQSTSLHSILLHIIAYQCISLHIIAYHCMALHVIAYHCISLHIIA